MMNKILLTVKVPMIEKTYDIKIPISKNIGVASNLLIEAINELSEGHYPKKKDAVLNFNKTLSVLFLTSSCANGTEMLFLLNSL